MNISHLPVLSGIGPNHSDVVETRRASLRPSETLTITSTRAEISVSQVPTNLPAIANNPSLCAPRMPSSSPCRGKTSRADFGNEPLRMREAGPGAGAAFSSADRNSVSLRGIHEWGSAYLQASGPRRRLPQREKSCRTARTVPCFVGTEFEFSGGKRRIQLWQCPELLLAISKARR